MSPTSCAPRDRSHRAILFGVLLVGAATMSCGGSGARGGDSAGGSGGATPGLSTGGSGPTQTGGTSGSSGSGATGGNNGSGGGGVSTGGGGAATGGRSGGGGAPVIADFTNGMWSGTVLGIPGNELLTAQGPFTNTYRTYVKPRVAGQWRWAFWMSNATDSTWGPGAPMPNLPGSTWRIEAATFADGGTTRGGAVVAGTVLPVTFSSSTSKTVQPGERFWSDPVSINLADGHYLAFTWTVSSSAAGPVLPFTSAPFVTSYQALGMSIASQVAATGFATSTDPLVAPPLFAYDRPVTRRLCFLGDSITQGIGSTRDSYGFWVAKIADGLGPDTSVWNLGSGWARAADAASDGYWLYKAEQCTEVAVILGVNDIINSNRTSAQILSDLTTIMQRLKQHNASIRIILFTVPTFNLSGQAYTTWKTVNDSIRAQPLPGADRVFDVAAVLSQPAPNDGLVQPAFINGDPHPNDVAGTAIANAFLAWY
jgi:lysophospholipase L1-like esterase